MHRIPIHESRSACMMCKRSAWSDRSEPARRRAGKLNVFVETGHNSDGCRRLGHAALYSRGNETICGTARRAARHSGSYLAAQPTITVYLNS
jgi:hypothetical protein